MTTAPTSTATIRALPPSAVSAPPVTIPVSEVLRAASDLVVDLDLDDEVWTDAGPHLTAIVDRVRRALDGRGSTLFAARDVAPVLRLRDLARTAQASVGAPSRTVVVEEVRGRLQALAAAVQSGGGPR